MHVRELADIPEGVRILDAPDAVIVQVVKPGAEAPAAGEGEVGPAEPELIKREKKKGEDEE